MADTWMLLLTAAAAVIGGGIASIAGFGIGSVLTPVFAVQTGTRLAVAAVSIPHFVATALRFWMLRRHVDRRILWSFGLTSAAGGLTGALLQSRAGNPALTFVFGGLLVFAGVTGLVGIADRFRFRGWAGWTAGALSGFLGGLVGNQGGIRSAAMLGFDVSPQAFVATATAAALFVDAARVPVYLATQGAQIGKLWPLVATATVGVLIGTLLGKRVLQRIPQPVFRRAVSAIILVLGVWMLWAGR